MSGRDKTIDHLRGIATLWVIVVHVLYYGDFFSSGYINLLKSFCLFEMPLFFFVTGAGNSLSKTDRYFRFIYKRFMRILIPYWAYALICAALSIAYLGIYSGTNIITAIKILLSWLIPVNRQASSIPYLTWALWYVPVYLCVILILPFLRQMRSSKNAIIFLFSLSALFAITCLGSMGWIQNVVFYSLWTYIGLFYDDIVQCLSRRSFRRKIGLAALIGTVSILVLYTVGQPIDMQHNKFPPNIIFCLFSAVVMSLILLMIPHIDTAYRYIEKSKPAKRIADLFSTRSMTIYLYQAFAFNYSIRLTNALIPGGSTMTSVIKLIFCLVITIPICIALAFVFGGIEKLGIKRRKTVYSGIG